MTSTRIAEAKGILFLLFIIGLLAVVMMAASGKLEEWFGIHLFRAPNVAGKITFVSDRNGHNDIWVMNSDGSEQQPLTKDDFDDISPVWSPDGTEIIFVSNRDNGRYQLYAVPYNGGRIRKLSLSSGTKSNPVFSPDGKEVAFLSSGKVAIRDVDGQHEHQVLPGEEQARLSAMQDQDISFSQVDWSASGDWLAAVHRLEPGEAVVLTNLKTGEAAPVKDDQGRPLVGGKIEISWSVTGARLVTAVRNGVMGNYAAVLDLDREAFFPIIQAQDNRHAAVQPAWSPDDSTVALVSATVDKEGNITPMGLLTVSTSDGTSEEIDKGRCEHPRWSRDGKKIAYTKSIEDIKDVWAKDVWIIDSESHKTSNLTNGKGNNFDACWAPGVPK